MVSTHGCQTPASFQPRKGSFFRNAAAEARQAVAYLPEELFAACYPGTYATHGRFAGLPMNQNDYSAVFLDHYRRPRNLGSLDAPDGMALLHDDTCGDVLRLVIQLEGAKPDAGAGKATIRAARFKAFGCAATVAVGSIVTEMAIGMSVRAAAALSANDLAEALGGLPAGRLHAAVLGRAALRVAIGQAAGGQQKTGATER